MKTIERRQRLIEAHSAGTLVRFSNRFEPGWKHGYVLGVGESWMLLAEVNDAIWLDGYVCVRIADLRKLRPDPYAEFIETALQKRGEVRPSALAVDLTDLQSVLRSAAVLFPLLTVHREKFDPGICQIGRLVEVTTRRLQLLEIDPAGHWDTEIETYPLRDITRVEFGGDYEEALFLVGGEPPTSN